MSNDTTEEIKRNILSPSQWVRILFMLLYGVVCWLLTFVIAVIAIIQAIISLITGQDNRDLRNIGDKIAEYVFRMIRFLVYATDDKPFFGDADNGGNGGDDDDDNDDDDGYASSYSSTPANDSGPQSATGDSSDDVFSDMSFTDTADAEDASDDDDRKDPS